MSQAEIRMVQEFLGKKYILAREENQEDRIRVIKSLFYEVTEECDCGKYRNTKQDGK